MTKLLPHGKTGVWILQSMDQGKCINRDGSCSPPRIFLGLSMSVAVRSPLEQFSPLGLSTSAITIPFLTGWPPLLGCLLSVRYISAYWGIMLLCLGCGCNACGRTCPHIESNKDSVAPAFVVPTISVVRDGQHGLCRIHSGRSSGAVLQNPIGKISFLGARLEPVNTFGLIIAVGGMLPKLEAMDSFPLGQCYSQHEQALLETVM